MRKALVLASTAISLHHTSYTIHHTNVSEIVFDKAKTWRSESCWRRKDFTSVRRNGNDSLKYDRCSLAPSEPMRFAKGLQHERRRQQELMSVQKFPRTKKRVGDAGFSRVYGSAAGRWRHREGRLRWRRLSISFALVDKSLATFNSRTPPDHTYIQRKISRTPGRVEAKWIALATRAVPRVDSPMRRDKRGERKEKVRAQPIRRVYADVFEKL